VTVTFRVAWAKAAEALDPSDDDDEEDEDDDDDDDNEEKERVGGPVYPEDWIVAVVVVVAVA
jgi:hypothetical protein